MSNDTNAPKFSFVGETPSSEKEPKVDWKGNPELCAVLTQMHIAKAGTKALQAKAREVLGLDRLPKSYENKNAASLFDGLVKRFKERVLKGHQPSIDAALAIGLIQPVEEPEGEAVEA